MEILVLVFLVIAVVVFVLVARARGGFRRWDDTRAWEAFKRVGHQASEGKEKGR